MTPKYNFQKRPKLVEAYQINYMNPVPEAVADKLVFMQERWFVFGTDGQYRLVNDTDWVIRDRDKEHWYPVSDEIFRAMYDEYNGA